MASWTTERRAAQAERMRNIASKPWADKVERVAKAKERMSTRMTQLWASLPGVGSGRGRAPRRNEV